MAPLRHLRIPLLASLATLVSATALAAHTTPTHVMVRVTAHDAKIVGSAVGGASVVTRDATTGAVPAEGVQEGGTGGTQRIMIDPHPRRGRVVETAGGNSPSPALSTRRCRDRDAQPPARGPATHDTPHREASLLPPSSP